MSDLDGQDGPDTGGPYERSRHPLTTVLGPCLTEQAVARRFAINDLRVMPALADTGQILRVMAPNGEPLYPEWQLDGGEVDPRVMDLLGDLGDLGDPTWLTAAIWMCLPDSALDGATPVEWLRDGQSGEIPGYSAGLTAGWYADQQAREVYVLWDHGRLRGIYRDHAAAVEDAEGLLRTSKPQESGGTVGGIQVRREPLHTERQWPGT